MLAIHGGMNAAVAWAAVSALLPGQGAAHGRLRAAGRHPDAALVGASRPWPRCGSASKRTHGSLGFAWLALGNAGIDMAAADAPGALHRRLRPVVRLRDDGGRAGAGCAGASAPALLWLLPLPFLIFCRPCRTPGAATRPPCWCSRTYPKTGVDPGIGGPHAAQSGGALLARACWAQTEQSAALVVWPEVPAPFYYDDDPRFRDYPDDLARLANAYLLIGVVAHTPRARRSIPRSWFRRRASR